MVKKNTTATTVSSTAFFRTTAVPISWIETILNKIPLPRWAIYALAGVALFLILLIIICCCCCCCKRKKNQKKKEKINLGNLKGKVTTSLVTVAVKQAAALKAMDSGGTSDPYATVYLTNDSRRKSETKVHRKTLSPVFNEAFIFKVLKTEIPDTAVVIHVYDFNRFSKHDMIGEVRLPLGEMDLHHIIEDWKELTPGGKTEQERLGEICFSLRYVPGSSKLTVVILEAKKLKKMDSDGFSDPYVKVGLALNKKKWKRKKTSVKKNTINPYFNEAFTFDVTLEQIQNVDLIISVWDHDKVNKNEQIGKVFLGSRASGNGLRHWSDMLAHPRRPMAQWHNLQPAEEVDKILSLKSNFKLPIPEALQRS
uniref:Synaptotagmin 8 n=1 Tax=Leptobrachium leishanense TaxID=445787 RepID=A0A8C5R4X3_9ANUR